VTDYENGPGNAVRNSQLNNRVDCWERERFCGDFCLGMNREAANCRGQQAQTFPSERVWLIRKDALTLHNCGRGTQETQVRVV